MEEHRINCKRGPSFSPEQSSVTVLKNNKSLIKKIKKIILTCSVFSYRHIDLYS
jgi:hypothetical protein